MEPPPAPSFLSESEVIVASLAGGRFLEVRYTWSHEGKAHEGFMLLVPVCKRGVATGAWTGAWIDSWHQSTHPMQLQGEIDANGLLSLSGTFPAPPDPDWGWRITLESPSEREFHLTMYVITPGGDEALAVKGEYARA